MRTNQTRRILTLLASAPLLVAASSPAAAQIIRGKLIDQTASQPVGGAAIALLTDQNAQVASSQTSGSGDFTLRAPSAGIYRIRFSKDGYRAGETPAIELQAPDQVSLNVKIVPNKTELSPVIVTSNSRRPSGRLGGFYERMQHKKFGTFITSQQIEKRRPFNVSDLLAGAAGIIVQPSRRGFGNEVRTTQRCRPTVYLDGLPFPLMGESIDNLVNPMQLEGIEVYPNALDVPGELQRGLSRCGVVALWTKA